MTLVMLLLLALLFGLGNPVCRLMVRPQPPEFSRDGDFIIGGIFTFRTGYVGSVPTFRSIPRPPTCLNMNFREFQFAQTMIFAIEEINRNTDILPDHTLGYKIFNACGFDNILMSAVSLASGQKEFADDHNCTKDMAHTIIGHSGSTPTIGIARIVGRFYLPVISHFATCACLSNRREYPSFFRTIPSDLYQSRALAKLVKHFGWTWVGAVCSDNDYGLNGMSTFIQAAEEEGVCLEYSEAFDRSGPKSKLLRIVEVIKQASSKVIVAFVTHREIKVLVQELYRQNISGLQWIGSDAWITDTSLIDSQEISLLVGSVGFAVSTAHIPGLGEHLKQVHPSHFPNSMFLRDFWETVFDCSLNENAESHRIPCNGSESLRHVTNEFTDVSDVRFSNNVYKAVYAVAHALQDLLSCEHGQGPFSNRSCAEPTHIQPWQVLHYLQTVNFTTDEREWVYFDPNGDSPARYDLVNLQSVTSQTLKFANVGFYDASLPKARQFTMTSVRPVWVTGNDTVHMALFSYFWLVTRNTVLHAVL